MNITRPLRREQSASGDRGDVNARLTEDTYIELVRSVFTTIVPTSIMTICFMTVGLFIVGEIPDPALLLFFALGVLASFARLAILLFYRKKAARAKLDGSAARVLERRFALTYLAFAITFGAFAARAYTIVPSDGRILLVGLLYGYGAGVAAGASLRPWISIPAVLLAIGPSILIGLFQPGIGYWGTSLITALFLAGGIESMLKRYQATSRQIGMHRMISALARQDELTGLPNRVLLSERFAEIVAAAVEANLVAVHCLDLGEFQQVNQMYGYPVGDALLKAMAERLKRILPADDFAVRLGGIEFVVVQPGIVQGRQAEILAQHVLTTLARTYSIAGHDISIRPNIGYAFALQVDADLDQLLKGADEAMRRARSEAIGIACFNQPKWTAA